MSISNGANASTAKGLEPFRAFAEADLRDVLAPFAVPTFLLYGDKAPAPDGV